MTTFKPGRYLCRIENQSFIESTQKGTPGFRITFCVLKSLSNPDEPVKQYQRDCTWWLSENTVKRVLRDLHRLGYGGDTLAGVDPDTRGFHNFAGEEVELMCVDENNQYGDVRERWYVAAAAKPASKAEIAKWDQFLAMDGANGSAADDSAADDFGQGIDHEDVPL
jgi:hypothetical protein